MLVIVVLFDLCRGGCALAHPPLDFTFFLVIGFVVVLLAIRVLLLISIVVVMFLFIFLLSLLPPPLMLASWLSWLQLVWCS